MTTFQDFALPEALQHKLDALGFDTPTPVQERAIPAALEHRDILGSAQTGTGKTAAFSIPLLTKIMNHADIYASSSHPRVNWRCKWMNKFVHS